MSIVLNKIQPSSIRIIMAEQLQQGGRFLRPRLIAINYSWSAWELFCEINAANFLMVLDFPCLKEGSPHEHAISVISTFNFCASLSNFHLHVPIQVANGDNPLNVELVTISFILRFYSLFKYHLLRSICNRIDE